VARCYAVKLHAQVHHGSPDNSANTWRSSEYV